MKKLLHERLTEYVNENQEEVNLEALPREVARRHAQLGVLHEE